MQGLKQKRNPDITYGGCDGHAGRNDALPLIEDFGFSEDEKTVLQMIRHFSCAMALPGYDGAQRAAECGRSDWIPCSVPRILDALSRLLATMRKARNRSFDFIVPDCPSCCRHICQSELELMLMLRAARQRSAPRLETAARLVADGGDPGALIVAADHVARQLDRSARMHVAGPMLLH